MSGDERWVGVSKMVVFKAGPSIVAARKLRLAVITNVWQQGLLTTEEAETLLRGRVDPCDECTAYDDSKLLGRPLGPSEIT